MVGTSGSSEEAGTSDPVARAIAVARDLRLAPGDVDVVELAARLFAAGAAPATLSQTLWDAALAVRHRHEWIDGSGEPDGLAGDDIPIGSRILAVVGMFDGLTTPRPYRDAMREPEALSLMHAACDSRLDRDCFHALARCVEREAATIVRFDRMSRQR